MRRVSFTLFATVALLMMSALPLPVAAVGEVQASLSCSDGTTTDLFSDAGYTSGTYLDWYFREGRANTTNPPLYGNSAPLAATTCTSAPTFNDTLEHGRILVKEHA